MAKPRDYKAENKRRESAKIAERVGGDVSSWRISNTGALRKLFNDEQYNKLHNLIMSGRTKDDYSYKLLKIGRLCPEVAVALLDKPEDIDLVFKKNKSFLDEKTPKRVTSYVRISRAWDANWQRWLQKFDPEDWQYVRKECARRILQQHTDASQHE